MGCLIELIFEIIVEGLMELAAYCYIKLMTLIVPEKTASPKALERIKKAVSVWSWIQAFALGAGIFLWVINEPCWREAGITLTVLSGTVIAIQILLGIAIKVVRFTRKK